MIQHLLGIPDISRACMYCGTKFDGKPYREIEYVVKECQKCRRVTRIRMDFNNIGNGYIDTIDDKIKEETRKIFINTRMF